ncbi:hypothetical protein HNQ85_000764 [Anoxybacillus calidus]|jgi:hypothetical protein|uniref:Uncharacterized protein n=2 Tax=[Anoxybacillus] calidus TaxID=575178 RepID=A0A7W0BVS6_9BACL|nr:hypothetical protein [Anoxybacillus calidus]
MEWKQVKMEVEYDTKMNNNQASDLLQKKHNFSIANTEVKQIIMDEKKILHTGFHDNGTISFTLTNGKIHSFIILKNNLTFIC